MKIYVDLYVPGNGKTYEYEISDSLKIDEVKNRLVKETIEFENGNISFGENPILFSYKSKTILADNTTLLESDVRSGDTLLLI